MKKILFLFRSDFSELKTHWWHRLLIIVFIITVFFAGTLTWQSLNHADINSYTTCLGVEIAIYDNSTSPDADQKWEKGKSECLDTFNQIRQPIPNLIFGMVVAIATFYILQLFYYKLVLYVIYGRKYMR